jgi:sigma-B regulation protein RsbU (phosphoserine phosphatase)
MKISSNAKEDHVNGFLNVLVFLAIAGVAYADWVVVAPISLGYLYILPISLCALINPLPFSVTLALACTALHDIFGPTIRPLSLRLTHNAIDLLGFLMAGIVVTLIARKRDRLAMEVRRQRDDYEKDLELAAHVQRRILPLPPVIPGFDMAAAMVTARLLGGDYYDFVRVSDNVVDVVIADVSGKGAAAALLMPSLAVGLRLTARQFDDPAEVIADSDRVLKQVTDSRTFVTMFYGRLDCSARKLRYVNAGHNPPILLRSKTAECIHLDDAGGPILGLLPNAQFSSASVDLEPGDILALYTDGVTEQENKDGEQFSLERLAEIIRAHSSYPAANLAEDVTRAVRSYAPKGDLSDDVTVLIVKVEIPLRA